MIIEQSARVLSETGVLALNIDNSLKAPGLCEFVLKCAKDIDTLAFVGTVGLRNFLSGCEPIYIWTRPGNEASVRGSAGARQRTDTESLAGCWAAVGGAARRACASYLVHGIEFPHHLGATELNRRPRPGLQRRHEGRERLAVRSGRSGRRRGKLDLLFPADDRRAARQKICHC